MKSLSWILFFVLDICFIYWFLLPIYLSTCTFIISYLKARHFLLDEVTQNNTYKYTEDKSNTKLRDNSKIVLSQVFSKIDCVKTHIGYDCFIWVLIHHLIMVDISILYYYHIILCNNYRFWILITKERVH